MSIGPLVSLASGYIQSLFSNPQSGSSSTNATTAGASGNIQDTNGLSPFAQVLSSLQQLQQSNPTQYAQVTQQISANLQTAAQTATTNGNSSLATELTQLSTDFKSASTSGQLPNIQDLAQAIGGGHHHHQHGGGASSASTSAPGSSATSPTDSLSQLIQSLNSSQTGTIANNTLNPLSIIDNTLSSAGIQVD
jgi:hypothetical protein